MEEGEIAATFGPRAGDRETLSSASRMTMDALYQHPLSHNLEWTDVIALFAKLGTVEQKGHNGVAFSIGGEYRRIRQPHGKDLTTEDVMSFRHMLSRAGWSPQASPAPVAPDVSSRDVAAIADLPNLLVVVDHHEARIYHLDLQPAEPLDHVIKPHDPQHFLHHLTHKDQSRERGQRAPEDASFYGRLAEAAASARAIVVIGHGAGHSSAADRLVEFLRLHHPETFAKVTREVVADLSRLTTPQLLVLGRRALSSLPGSPA
jgi:hypothetical protein